MTFLQKIDIYKWDKKYPRKEANFLIDNEIEEIIVTKQKFYKKIGEFVNPQFTIKYIKDLKLVECKALCDLRNLKVPKPPKEPNMNTLGNITIKQLTDIIK